MAASGAIGNRRSTVVPPASSCIEISPPSSLVTSACTIERPSPREASSADAVVGDLHRELTVAAIEPHHDVTVERLR